MGCKVTKLLHLYLSSYWSSAPVSALFFLPSYWHVLYPFVYHMILVFLLDDFLLIKIFLLVIFKTFIGTLPLFIHKICLHSVLLVNYLPRSYMPLNSNPPTPLHFLSSHFAFCASQNLISVTAGSVPMSTKVDGHVFAPWYQNTDENQQVRLTKCSEGHISISISISISCYCCFKKWVIKRQSGISCCFRKNEISAYMVSQNWDNWTGKNGVNCSH